MDVVRKLDRRALLGFAAGGLIVAALRGRTPPGAAWVLVADRGAGRVVGLDPDLRFRSIVRIDCPIALAGPGACARMSSTDCVGTWVASAPRGTPSDGPVRLHLLDGGGDVRATSEQVGLRAMRGDARGRLWLVRGSRGCEELCVVDASASAAAAGATPGAVEGAPERVEGDAPASAAQDATHLDEDAACGDLDPDLLIAREVVIASVPDAVHVAVAQSGAWLVAQRDGTLTAGNAEGDVVARSGPRVRDVQPAAQGFWLLGDRVLSLVGEGLEPLGEEPLLERAGRLLPVVGGEAVWHLGADGRSAIRRSHDEPPLVVSELPLAGIRTGVGLSDGGLLLVAPGAILRLDERGAFAAGQGGFRELSDLALAPSV